MRTENTCQISLKPLKISWLPITIFGFFQSLSLTCVRSPPPPPPTNTINTANEGRFRLNVDSPYGERAQSTVLTRAPPRRPARPHQGFIFNLSMRESKASPVVVCFHVHHAEGRRHFRLGVSSSVGHCCQHFWVSWVGTQPNKGRTSPWQMPAGQAGAANISWSASAGRR